jgi:type II secretory pathway component PulF
LQSGHNERWRAMVEGILQPVPVLGSARRSLALGRLAAALEALLNAGVTIVEAWELAGRASGSPALSRAVLAWRPLLDGGCTPAEVLHQARVFPEFFATQYRTGEISGKLDDTLHRLQKYYQDDGTRKLHAFAQWTPRAVYLLVAFLIAWRVIAFYSGYFKMVRDAGGF